MKKFLPAIILIFISFCSFSQIHDLKGKVTSVTDGDLLIGATVKLSSLEEPINRQAAVGLDGSYHFANLQHAKYKIEIFYVGFSPISEEVEVDGSPHNYQLKPNYQQLSAVLIESQSRGTDAEARAIEKASQNVMNVISAKQIQLSPDITVANVIQRVSGLSIERNANGDPQYAIVRGMDKRYNNTLVNGIKIPSPDNDNRFVPLDIFPAVFLDRLEVHKSLSADMEADAIGGTVNMVMKDVPASGRILDADVQLGYNQMNVDGDFATYSRSQLHKRSPSELFGPNYEAVPGDFPGQNMVQHYKTPLPDVIANATYGDRLLDQKLGLMLGASFQNSYRPSSYYSYDPGIANTAGNPILLNEFIERRTSAQQQRIAFHGKATYDIDNKNKVGLYGGHYLLNEFRVRDQVRREAQGLTVDDGYPAYLTTRFSNTYQTISTANLNGEHKLLPAFDANWNLVYAHAKNDRPDDGVFNRSAEYDVATNAYLGEAVYFASGRSNTRTWERNTDEDLAAYLDFKYRPEWLNDQTLVKFGGVYRNKTRDNYYNYYSYNATLSPAVKGIDWDTFADVPFPQMANGYGDGNESNLVYDAHERIIAYYLNTDWHLNQTHVQVGLRAEHTEQDYAINPISAASNATDLNGKQNYTNLFPSLSIKQLINSKTNVKATYFKGISRPGFFEIVPTTRSRGGGDSFYSERGNPDLRPTIAHSFDLRYEYFPTLLDQLLAGIFYKRIIDPIEYGFPQLENADSEPSTGRILPQNFGKASNFGAELDMTRYFNRFGIRANYTYTHSRVTTNKVTRSTNEEVEAGARAYNLVEQRRPLQGQSAHVANLSLLYKDQVHKWDVQLVFNYTGKRIALVSPYFEADQIMRPMTVMDLSVEKGIGRIVLFVKANNLLNTPYQLIVDKPLARLDLPYPHQDDGTKQANIRRDLYGQSYRLGLRYRLGN